MDLSTGAQVSFEIKNNVSDFVVERRFATNQTVGQLKGKLELITGANSGTMTVQLLSSNNLVATLDDDRRLLSSYLTTTDGDSRLSLQVTDPNLSKQTFDDLSGVEKFELSDEKYEERQDTVRAFKMQNKLGRFAEDAAKREEETARREQLESEKAASIGVDSRCLVTVKGQPTRRGTVAYVGTTNFKPGVWVGIRYDEPLGKNDGSVGGRRYFECRDKYGGFVRPSDVRVGDYQEEAMDLA